MARIAIALVKRLPAWLAAGLCALFLSSCATVPTKPRLTINDVATSLKAATASKKTARSFYNSLPTGEFRGEPTLVWIGPNRFRFEQKALAPFQYIPHGGKPIVPGEMETDGGSIPKGLWAFEGLSPWDYAPAYIIHDWLFVKHYDRDSEYAHITLKEAGLIMASGIKTLMEAPYAGSKDPVPANPDLLYRIYNAVISRWADGLWDRYHVPGLPRED